MPIFSKSQMNREPGSRGLPDRPIGTWANFGAACKYDTWGRPTLNTFHQARVLSNHTGHANVHANIIHASWYHFKACMFIKHCHKCKVDASKSNIGQPFRSISFLVLPIPKVRLRVLRFSTSDQLNGWGPSSGGLGPPNDSGEFLRPTRHPRSSVWHH